MLTKMNYSKESSALSLNKAFHEVVCKIKNEGIHSAPRGQEVKELELETLAFSPVFAIPEFSARKFNWKYFAGELAWYLQKDTNIGYISEFSNFWSGIANSQGYINSNYGNLLFGNQLQWALDSLRKDKNTRQAVCFLNQPKFQYEGNKDFVCTMYINFWIRDNRLNMKVQMRSNDVFYGLSYDAPFFALVMQNMWHWLVETYEGLELGTYYHSADNIHFYQRHFELADKIVAEDVQEPTYFMLRGPLFKLNDGEFIWTQESLNFIKAVDELLDKEDATQEDWKKCLINNIIYIQ